MSVILLEGPDGGGKTYAAKHQFAAYEYQHNGPPDPNDIFWWQYRRLMNRGTKPNWVVDRSWPSEQIYHRFVSRPHTFGPLQQRMFERFMFANQGIVIMCLPPYHVAYAEWRKRADEGKELLTRDSDFATMYYFYKEWQTRLPLIHYDYTRAKEGDLYNAVASVLSQYTPNAAPGVVYGNPGARILIVGDVYNFNKNPAGPHIPFVGTGRNGFWLTQQLELLGLREDDLAWVNAYQSEGQPTNSTLVRDALPYLEVVVALGREAADWAKNFKQPTLFTPHPAFWTRFKSKEPWPLLECREYLTNIARKPCAII